MKKYSIITIALFLCLSMFFHTSAIAIETLVPDTVYWEDKIDESVYESPIYENGKRLIYIERESIPKELVAKNLKQKYNYSMDVYENEVEYEKQIVPAVTARVVAELGETAAYSTAEQLQLTGESISPVDRALSDDYNDYIMAKRAATKELYVASTDTFMESKIDNSDDVLYQGSYISDFILYATDDEIKKYAKSPDVMAIYPYHNTDAKKNAIPEEQIQISIDSITGTKSSSFNAGYGYQGDGVKIGIIEAGDGKYDPYAPQLRERHESGLLQYKGSISGTGIIDDHATMVTSIIAGHAFPHEGITYEGVVPNATVYFYSINTPIDVLNAFSNLADLGVSVINFSGSYNPIYSGYYFYDLDGPIDRLVDATNITFVVSAGNQGTATTHVTSPANAYNVISVGNAFTKVYVNNGITYTPTSPLYTMHETSSYTEDERVGNRPDVVAPGCGIVIPFFESDNTTVTTDPSIPVGTSFSAPLVTGIVAQLHQAKPTLKLNPTATKAIIVAGADPSLISYSDDLPTDDCEYLMEKSGAGMVNAVNSLNIALNNQYLTYQFTIGSEADTYPFLDYLNSFYAPQGQRVKVVLSFIKIKSLTITNSNGGTIDEYYPDRLYDIDFTVGDNDTDEIVASSTMLYNQLQIAQFYPITSGYFHINAILTAFEPQSTPTPLTFSFAWCWPDSTT